MKRLIIMTPVMLIILLRSANSQTISELFDEERRLGDLYEREAASDPRLSDSIAGFKRVITIIRRRRDILVTILNSGDQKLEERPKLQALLRAQISGLEAELQSREKVLKYKEQYLKTYGREESPVCELIFERAEEIAEYRQKVATETFQGVREGMAQLLAQMLATQEQITNTCLRTLPISYPATWAHLKSMRPNIEIDMEAKNPPPSLEIIARAFRDTGLVFPKMHLVESSQIQSGPPAARRDLEPASKYIPEKDHLGEGLPSLPKKTQPTEYAKNSQSAPPPSDSAPRGHSAISSVRSFVANIFTVALGGMVLLLAWSMGRKAIKAALARVNQNRPSA